MANSSKVNYEGFEIESRFIDGKTIINAINASDIKSTPRKTEERVSPVEWIASGANDDHLTKMRELAEDSTVILPGLRFNASMRYGGGIEYGIEEVQNGEKVFVPQIKEEIDTFLRRNKMAEQMFIALLDMEAFSVCYFQHALSNDGKKIVQTNSKFTRACWCRMSKRDANGDVPIVHVNADFGTKEFKKENTKKISAAPEFITDEWIDKQKKSKKNFVSIHQVPDLGRMYYTLSDWYSAVNAGWYDIAKMIASSKKFMFENQFAIKYHVKVSPEYWKTVYGSEQWARWKDTEKSKKKEEELERIVKYLQGTEAYGSTFFSEKVDLKNGDKLEDSITIDVIKNDFSSSGEFMKESNEASDHMLSAMSIHPDIIGNAPGSSLGAGSGSGNRVAFNQRVALSLIYQEIVLDALRIVSDFNGWGVKFRMRNSLITTLDTGASATKPTANIPTA